MIKSEIAKVIKDTDKFRFVSKKEIIEFFESRNIPLDEKPSKVYLIEKLREYFSEDRLLEFDGFSKFGLMQKEVLELLNVTRSTFVKICERENISYTKAGDDDKVIYVYKISDILHLYDVVSKENLQRKEKAPINVPELTDENIAEALYIINKSAKVSRDTKQSSYYERRRSACRAAKTRERKLYDLKNDVIKKLIKENRVKFVGYHKQNIYDDYNDCDDCRWLAYYQLAGYGFHQIVYNPKISKSEMADAKEISGIISSKRTLSSKMKFTTAVALLETYVDKSICTARTKRRW